MLKPNRFALILAVIMAFSSCTVTYHQQAYYVSPFNGNSTNYHALPMHTDTALTAVYARVSGFGGYANTLQTDHYGGGNVSVYVAHHGDWWQAYYGLDGTLGGYTLGSWRERFKPNNFNPLTLDFQGGLIMDDEIYKAPVKGDQLNSYTGAYTYGGVGFSGGFNGVIPMGQGEWRVLGIETDLHHEFGQYLRLRENMPDSIAGYIVRNRFYGTLGLTSEWVFRTRTGDFGFRLAGGWVLGGDYHPAGIYDSVTRKQLNYGGYASFSAHYTTGRYTIYYQAGSAAKANSYQLGFIYRFSSPRVPAKIIHKRERGSRPLPPGWPRPGS